MSSNTKSAPSEIVDKAPERYIYFLQCDYQYFEKEAEAERQVLLQYVIGAMTIDEARQLGLQRVNAFIQSEGVVPLNPGIVLDIRQMPDAAEHCALVRYHEWNLLTDERIY
jgi:hypothetical protein